jgi:hypothetical protein
MTHLKSYINHFAKVFSSYLLEKDIKLEDYSIWLGSFLPCDGFGSNVQILDGDGLCQLEIHYWNEYFWH